MIEDSRKQWTLTVDISELEREKKALEKGNSKNNRRVKEFKKELELVRARLNVISGNSIPLPPSRKRGSGYETCKS